MARAGVFFFAWLGITLVGCSGVIAVQQPSHVFHPYVEDATPIFRVVDRRPDLSSKSRRVRQSAGISTWYYGDEQFSPNPLRVIAVRFAQELPRSGPEDELVISDLEISYQLDSMNGWLGPTCSELLIDCFMMERMEEVERYSQNVVRTRLSGTFDGVMFSATYSAEYKADLPDKQEEHVLSALYAVIDRALKDVRTQLNATSINHDHDALPDLPRPRYMPTPSQLGPIGPSPK